MESHIKPLECGSSPTKMKQESQVGYADILVLFFI